VVQAWCHGRRSDNGFLSYWATITGGNEAITKNRECGFCKGDWVWFDFHKKSKETISLDPIPCFFDFAIANFSGDAPFNFPDWIASQRKVLFSPTDAR
jgi:hypothetical protein